MIDKIIIGLGETTINVIGICLVFALIVGTLVAISRILGRIFK